MKLNVYGLILILASISASIQSNNDPFKRPNPVTVEIQSKNPSITTIKSLLKKGVPVEFAALKQAVLNGNTEIVKYLLKYYHNINKKDEAGKTLLFYAIEKNYKPIVILLIEHGANVNEKNTAGNTPIMITTNRQIEQILLEHGANLNHNPTALKEFEEAMKTSIQNGNPEIVKYFLKFYTNINKQDEAGKTLLFYATKKNDIQIVKLLIDHGANVNAADSTGLTPLMTTTNPEIAEMLLDHGANVNATTNEDHQTALMFATGFASLDVNIKDTETLMQVLLNKGADVNAQDADGNTPLSIALKAYNQYSATEPALITIIYLLLQHKAKVHLTDLKLAEKAPFFDDLLRAYARLHLDIPDTYLDLPFWKNINIKKFFGPNYNSLTRLAVERLYQQYLAGAVQPLKDLLSNHNTPVSIQDYFNPDFVQQIRFKKER